MRLFCLSLFAGLMLLAGPVAVEAFLEPGAWL